VKEYIISRHDPKNQDNLGRYIVDEWKTYDDIGYRFNGEVLNYLEYLNAEIKYINAIELLMRRHCLGSMRTRYLLKLDPPSGVTATGAMKDLYEWLKRDRNISIQMLPTFYRLMLRDCILAKLVSPVMYVDYGYGYYLYIGVTEDCSKELCEIEASGLFVENLDDIE